MLESYIQRATQGNDHALTAEKALYAMAEFAAPMDETEIKPFLQKGLQIIDAFMNGPGQKRGVRYHALGALSKFIIVSRHLIHPYMQNLL
jgi:hypothetical protein